MERRPYRMFNGFALNFHPIRARSVVVVFSTQSVYAIPERFCAVGGVVSMERSGSVWHAMPACVSSAALVDSLAETRVNCFAACTNWSQFECQDVLMSADGMLCAVACLAAASSGSADLAEWWIVPSPLTITRFVDDRLLHSCGSFLQSKCAGIVFVIEMSALDAS